MFEELKKLLYIAEGRVHAVRRCEVLQSNDQQIFLIDEDDVVRDSLKVLLESHGGQVRDFRSPADFLASETSIRGGCLVLGFNRLIVDGLELVATLRRRGMTLPVIFIVGGGDAATKAAALAADAFAYLERPIEEAALIRTIRAALMLQNAGKPPDEGAQAADQQRAAAPAHP